MNYNIDFINNNEKFNGKTNKIGNLLTQILRIIPYLKKIDNNTFEESIIILNDCLNNTLIDTYDNTLIFDEFQFKIESEEEFQVLKNLILFIDEYINVYSDIPKYFNAEYFIYLIDILFRYDIPKRITHIENTSLIYEDIQKFSKDKYIYNHSNITNSVSKILKMVSEKSITYTCTYSYVCSSLNDIIIISMLELIQHKLQIKKCQLCKNYFIAYNRSDTKYCDNLYINIHDPKCNINNPETCSRYNKRISSFKGYTNDPLKRELRNVKQRIKARVRRGAETEQYLNEWMLKVAKKRKELISNEKFLEWLKESDEHSVKNKGGAK